MISDKTVHIIPGPSPSNPGYLIDAYAVDDDGKKFFLHLGLNWFIHDKIERILGEGATFLFDGETEVPLLEQRGR